MTWVSFVNYYILQWLFIRLTRQVDTTGKTVKWGLQGWVVPLTGWGSPFVYKRKWFIWL
jgi:hypothetical protein